MKPRKWVLFAVLIVLVLIVSLYEGIRYLERNRDLERILGQRIRPLVEGEFDLDRVRLGFLSATLTNVRLSIPLHALTLDIKDIRVGFSLRKLIQTKGDFGKSISTVVLVHPRITTSLNAPGSHTDTDNVQTLSQKELISAFRELPVDHIAIQKGAFLLTGPGGRDVEIGEELDGNIKESPDGLEFELRGRFGSLRPNFLLSGLIAGQGEQHRVSLRLVDAKIRNAVSSEAFTVTRATLDGVCEISFRDTTDIESNGSILIEKAEIEFKEFPRTVENITAEVVLTGTSVQLASLHGEWADAGLSANGVYDFSSDGMRRLSLRVSDLHPKEILSDGYESIRPYFDGNGWIALEISESERNGVRLEAKAGGYTSMGRPFVELASELRVLRDTVRVDTLHVKTHAYSLSARGDVLAPTKRPVYSFSTDFEFQPSYFVESMSGIVRATGSVYGTGEELDYSLGIAGEDLSFSGISLGNPSFSVLSTSTGLAFSTDRHSSSRLILSGAVDSLFSNPMYSADVALGSELLQALAEEIPFDTRGVFNGATLQGHFTGTAQSMAASGELTLDSAPLRGAMSLVVGYAIPDSMLTWQIADSRCTWSGEEFPLTAGGSYQAGTFVIDSLHAMHGLQASARVRLGEPVHLDARIDAEDLAMPSLDRWFLNGSELLHDGTFDIHARLEGSMDALNSHVGMRFRECDIRGFSQLQTDIVLKSRGTEITVLPFVVRKDNDLLLSIDTVTSADGFALSGEFVDLELQKLLTGIAPRDYRLRGSVSGAFHSLDSLLPLRISAESPHTSINEIGLDSLKLTMEIRKDGLQIDNFTAKDSTRSDIHIQGYAPWAFVTEEVGESDTLRAKVDVTGDLLASLGRHMDGPVGGHGVGEIHANLIITSEGLSVREATGSVPDGTLTVQIFMADPVENFYFDLHVEESGKAHTKLGGTVRGRPIKAYSTHDIPEGYEPFRLGPLDAGILLVETPKRGIDIHVVGFLEPGARADVEFAPRDPFPAFALSGPLDHFRITGTWILRNLEFTFPFLEEEVVPWDFDPFPYVEWELDIKPGNRRVAYFYDAGLRRRMIRFVEAYLEPGATLVQIRGRDMDKTFRIHGTMQSFKGEVFYGKTFDRNFEAGVEFDPVPLPDGRGYDNMPIIWGGAEAFSDSSRFDRIRLTLLVRDTTTGALAERGRFEDIRFRLSSEFDEIPGESERQFYQAAGLRFTTLAGAGGAVSNLGEQYLHRYLLQRFEKKLAKRLGLDVISFETSIASNYFNYLYERQSDDIRAQFNHLALANVGVTFGRYFVRDRLFLKWRSELIPSDTLLTPEHRIGMEFYPMRYLTFDASYGFYRDVDEGMFESNPRLNLQLRLPIGRVRKVLDF